MSGDAQREVRRTAFAHFCGGQQLEDLAKIESRLGAGALFSKEARV